MYLKRNRAGGGFRSAWFLLIHMYLKRNARFADRATVHSARIWCTGVHILPALFTEFHNESYFADIFEVFLI